MLLVSAILFLNNALTCCHIPGTNIFRGERGLRERWSQRIQLLTGRTRLPTDTFSTAVSYPESAADTGNQGVLDRFSVWPPINTTIGDNFLISHLAIIIALAFHSCDSMPLRPGPTGKVLGPLMHLGFPGWLPAFLEALWSQQSGKIVKIWQHYKVWALRDVSGWR